MRMLFLEDNIRLSELLVPYMRDNGFAVDHVERIAEARASVNVARYDVLVLDRVLADGDSFSWLRQERRRGLTAPVLFLSALGDLEERIFGLNAGADDYMTKPADPRELRARVHALVRRPPGVLSTELVCHDVALDPLQRELRINGTEVEVSPKEFALLELLLRNKDWVVSRTSLEEGLYEHGKEVTPNSIEVCISRLRRSLARAGSELTIKTVRGLGYRVLEPPSVRLAELERASRGRRA